MNGPSSSLKIGRTYKFRFVFHFRINNDYPPGSKSEALPLGVQLILFYFIRISILTPETFFPLRGGGWRVGGVRRVEANFLFL